MQYIQLQGQVAAELDLPINGAYNLFIDTADNSIKAKDGEGNLTGGGNSLTQITKTQLDQHISAGELTPGNFYKITGVSSGSDSRYIQEGGTTIILQAATTSSLNPRGVGLFWNPKYYNPNTDLGEYEVWHDTFAFTTDRYITGEFFDMEETINLDAPSNIILRPNILDNTMLARVNFSTSASFFLDEENYPISFESDNTAITGSLTGFNNAPPPFTSGSKVIWGGRVWQNLNGEIGSHDGQWTIAGPEWEVLPYNSTDYDLVADIIEYDYQNDIISYRKDVLHNIEVTSNFEWADDSGDNGIRQFPWGHPQIYNVSLENTATADFVNFDNSNRIHGLHMKRGSRFEANYWGKNNYFNDIFGDADSDIENLSLGRYATISNIRLGINSTIGGQSSLYIVGNDGDTITDITMGTNCDIYGMNMYQYSQIDEITMDTNASIYTMNMYDESYIRDLDMSMNSSLHDISMGNNSDMYNITLDADSYIANINLDADAQIHTTTLGRSSYIDYSSIGRNCSMYEISLGLDSYINCTNLYNSSNLSSNINSITLGDNSNLVSVALYGGTYLQDINTSNNCGIGDLIITGSDSYISDFQLEQNAGFGNLTVDGSQSGSVSFDNFKLGQDNGFGGSTYTSSMSNVTIERAFNNFEANNLIAGVTASFGSGFGWSDAIALNSLDSNKSFQILDTTGWDASESTLNYYLAGGDFDGQTIKFFMTSDGSNIDTNAGNLRIWLNTFSTMDNFSSIETQQPWYPFSQNTNYGAIRVDIPQCIWMGGRWIIDNDSWD